MEFLFSIYSSVELNLSTANIKPTKTYYKQFTKDFISFVSNKIIQNYSDSLIDYSKSIPENLESIYDNAVLSLNDTTKEKSVEEFLNRKNSNISYNLLPIYNHIESQYRKTLNAYKKSLFLQIKKEDRSPLFFFILLIQFQ